METMTMADDPAGITAAVEAESARVADLVELYAAEAAATVSAWMNGEEAVS